jgi:hypothetical protein
VSNPRAVTVVSEDTRTRGDLARYLVAAGFEVTEVRNWPRPPAGEAVVWLTERDLHPGVAATLIRTWLAAGDASRRAVVVTWRPAALRVLSDEFAGRLFVLPPPAFGWQVVDALRAGDPGAPEAA